MSYAKTKFKVGDKVRSICGYEAGNKGVVIDQIYPKVNRVVFDNGRTMLKHADYLELFEEPAQSSEILTRIAAIEKELTALKALVQADSKPTDSTPNAARKAVIERARAFVADLTKRAGSGNPENVGNVTFKLLRNKTEFHVNAEKGVVTALAKGPRYGALNGKAFARCAPGDVFNADIGKAIAVGRLYGVVIPQEFFDAPKPDEVVVGMRVRMNTPDGYISTIVPEGQFAGSDTNTVGWVRDNPDFLHAILDDTEAQY